MKILLPFALFAFIFNLSVNGQKSTPLDSLFSELEIEENYSIRAELLSIVTDHYIFTGQLDSASYYNEQFYEAEEQVSKENAKNIYHMNEGVIAHYRNDFRGAVKHFKHTLRISLSSGNKSVAIRSLDNIGGAFFRLGQPDSAIYYHRKAMPIAHEINDTLMLMKTHFNMANIFSQKSEFDSSIYYFDASKEYALMLNDEYWIAIPSIAKGFILGEMGNYEEALKTYFEAVPILEKRENARELIRTYGSIAMIYSQMENMEKEKEYYAKAISLNEKMATKVDEVFFLNNMTKIHLKEGNLSEAKRLNRKSFEQAKKRNGRLEIGQTHIIQARIFSQEGDLEASTKAVREAIRLFEQIDFKDGLTDALIFYAENINKLYEQTGSNQGAINKYGNTEQLLIKAKKTADVSQKVSSQLSANQALASYYQNRGDFKRANDLLKTIITVQDTLFDNSMAKSVAEYETKFQTEQKEKEIAVLEKDQAVKEAEIARQKTQILYAVGGILLVLSIAGLLYYRFRTVNQLQQKLATLNAAKDRLFAIISHDLRGSVSAFQGIGQIINYYIKKENYGQLQEVGKQVDKSAGNLNNLLDNLLQWSVSQMEGVELNPENVSVHAAVSEIVELFGENAAVKGIKLSSDVDANLMVHADMNSLKLVLRNLVSNAMKFSEEGDHIEITAHSSGDSIRIEIKDTGKGIDSEKMANIFNIDRKTSSKGTAGEQGVGLGLALCKEFAERNGGSIHLESEVGEGTRCRFELPKAA